MKLGIIATQIADDAGAAMFFDDLRPAQPARSDAEKQGRVSGTFVRSTPAPARAGRTPSKTPRRRA